MTTSPQLEFAARKRRQARLFWFGLLGVGAWMVLAFVGFAKITTARPEWNSPVLMLALLAPGFIVFLVVASRFTARNLRCPACDAAIAPYGTRYYASGFHCPHCREQLG